MLALGILIFSLNADAQRRGGGRNDNYSHNDYQQNDNYQQQNQYQQRGRGGYQQRPSMRRHRHGGNFNRCNGRCNQRRAFVRPNRFCGPRRPRIYVRF